MGKEGLNAALSNVEGRNLLRQISCSAAVFHYRWAFRVSASVPGHSTAGT